MSIGLGIFLIAIGAILTFALNVSVDVVNLDLIGWILMGAGLVVVIIGIALLTRKRRTVATSRVDVDPTTGSRVNTTERDDTL
jgi:protein-S-isoprenylcysteine O-methyltransferase Ste14